MTLSSAGAADSGSSLKDDSPPVVALDSNGLELLQNWIRSLANLKTFHSHSVVFITLIETGADQMGILVDWGSILFQSLPY